MRYAWHPPLPCQPGSLCALGSFSFSPLLCPHADWLSPQGHCCSSRPRATWISLMSSSFTSSSTSSTPPLCRSAALMLNTAPAAEKALLAAIIQEKRSEQTRLKWLSHCRACHDDANLWQSLRICYVSFLPDCLSHPKGMRMFLTSRVFLKGQYWVKFQ